MTSHALLYNKMLLLTLVTLLNILFLDCGLHFSMRMIL